VVRGEWEREITSDGPELKAARGSPAYELLAKKKVRRALKPVFETRVTRVAHPVEAGNSVVEISFDQGEIDTGRACWPISRWSLSSSADTPAIYLSWQRTSRGSPRSNSLSPGKAERGYVLLKVKKMRRLGPTRVLDQTVPTCPRAPAVLVACASETRSPCLVQSNRVSRPLHCDLHAWTHGGAVLSGRSEEGR
jgi:inorganic triphosphatase YgiF